MADIPSVTPVTPPTAAQPQQQGLADVIVQQAPASLAAPDQPVQIQGVVISVDATAQQISIQTPQGTVTVQAAAPQQLNQAPPQTAVSVEIYKDAATQKTLATVTPLKQNTPSPANALPPPAALTPLQEGDNVIALLMQDIENPLPPLPFADNEKMQGQGFIRQLISTYTQKGPEPLAPMPAVPESAVPEMIDNNLLHIMRAQLQARTTQQNLQAPAAAPKPAAGSPPLPSPRDWISSITETISQKPQGISSLIKQLIPRAFDSSAPLPQNMFKLNIAKILPPGTPAAQVKALLQKLPAGGQMAEVETITPQGFPILKAADGRTFVLRVPVQVATGSMVLFSATPARVEDAAVRQFLGLGDAEPPQSQGWPALQEALDTLQAMPGAAMHPAAQAMMNTLPTPTPQLVPAALFFIAALRSGDVENWLGKGTLQALKDAGKKGLAEQLDDDFGKISGQSKDAAGGEWKTISIPLRHDQQISQMQFYVRRQQEDSNSGKPGTGKPATRFILNLSLSRMGAMQLDGFIQKKTFDMILRTEEKLPFDIRQEIMKRFAAGLDNVSMQGGISFQTRKEGWMVPEGGVLKREI